MHSLFLHRLLYRFLQWGGHADARPTEFAATVVSADRRARGDGPGHRGPQAAPAGRVLPPDAALVPALVPALDPALSQIGRYLIKGRLGAGGLGEVFEAWDPLLSRSIAVKTLRLQLDADLRAMLGDHILKEARAAAGLSHPNIVTVFDAGLCTPGVYIAMERLHGRDLRQALATGWRPSPAQAAQLARRVAEALAYAHSQGVVHCDIKPANIFLDRDDRPKVLDFGIARVAHDSQLPASEDPLFGSPHYLAPEQLQHGVADARTDIRALGVVLYEMLTGHKAYTGDTVEQVVNAVLFNHPAPAHEARAGVPRALSAIAAKAMSLEPARRYDSADEMARELREWGERHSEPAAGVVSAGTAAAGIGGTRRRGAAAARQRPATVWSLAGLLLCVAAAAWLWWLPARAPGPHGARSAAPLPATSAAAKAPAAARVTAPRSENVAATVTATVAATNPGSAVAQPNRQTRAGDGSTGAVGRTGAGVGVGAGVGAGSASGSGNARPTPGKASTVAAAGSRNKAADGATGSGAVLLSISPWGQVEVNGHSAGTTPPLSRLSLPAGRHTITVRNDDFPVYTTTVVVQADKPAVVRHRFVQ